jgi:hypothetical protein
MESYYSEEQLNIGRKRTRSEIGELASNFAGEKKRATMEI